MIKSITLLIAVAMFFGVSNLNAQDFNKLKDKAKEVRKSVEPEKNKKQDEEKANNNSERKQQQSITSSFSSVKFDASKPIVVGFEKLLSKFNLNAQTGEFSIEEFQIKNLPFIDVNDNQVYYGLSNNNHKLLAIVKLNNNEIGRFAYTCYSGNVWTDARITTDDKFKKLITISEGGDYNIEFAVDDKVLYSHNIEIVQIANKNNKTGLFVNKPTEILGKLSFKDQSYGEANPNSELVFRFFYASLNVEDVFNDESPMNARLLKHDGDKYQVLGYTSTNIRNKSKWDITDNIFFEKPGERYKYVYGNEILSAPGNYSIDVTIDKDLYRYNFSVKDGKIVSSGYSGIDDGGAYWLKREKLAVPKYEGFRPTANTAGVKDNISLLITSADGKTTKGCGDGTPAAFSDGQKVIPNIYYKDATKQKFAYQNTEFITTLNKGSEIIAQHIQYKMFDNQPFAYIASSGDIDMKADFYTHVFMEAMAKLPAGQHQLTLVLELVSGSTQELIGVQNMTFTSANSNPKFQKEAELIKERMLMSESELADVRYMKYGGEDWAVYENNCGRIVWLRQDESKEYYLYSGDQGKFDRNGGPLEQWNFGTHKWLPINDFKPFKTIYRLTENDIAMLELKKMPKETTAKLKPMLKAEFQTVAEFENKVISLIGKDEFEKFKKQILYHGSVDYVKICN